MDEKELTYRCKQMDTEAQSVLYNRYADCLKAVCLRYAGNQSLAEDWMHDSFIKVMTSMDSFEWKGEGSLKSWMIRVARNYCIGELRKRITFEDISEGMDKLEETPQTSDISKETITHFIQKLPDQQRIVFVMYAMDGLSHSEIAEELGINTHSSSAHLARARKKLQTMVTVQRRRQYLMHAGIIAVLVGLVVMTATQLLRKSEPEISRMPVAKRVDNVDEKTAIPAVEIHAVEGATIPVAKASRPAVIDTPADTAGYVAQETTVPIMSTTVQDQDTIRIEDVRTISQEDYFAQREQEIRDSLTAAMQEFEAKHLHSRWSLGLTGNLWADNAVSKYDGQGLNMDISTNLTSRADAQKEHHEHIGPEDSFITIGQNGVSQKLLSSRNHRTWSAGLTMQYNLTDRLAVETGLAYTMLMSDVSLIYASEEYESSQTFYNIGMPLNIKYRCLSTGKWQWYVTGGGMVEKCLGAQVGRYFYRVRPLQYSLSGGIGMQYTLSPWLGLYVEPGVRYYFDNGIIVKTLRTESPCMFNLNIGLRFTYR